MATDFLTYITTILASMSGTVMLMCACVVWLGGWNWLGDKRRTTHLQRSVGMAFALSSFSIFLQTVLGGASISLNGAWTLTFQLLDDLPITCILFQAVHLQQQQLKLRHWMMALGPFAVLLLAVLLWGNTHQQQLQYALYGLYVYLLALYGVALFHLHRWDRQMLDEYSEVSHKQTMWFRRLTIPFILLILLWIPMFFFPNMGWLLAVYYVVEMVLTVAISSHALTQEEFEMVVPDSLDLTPDEQPLGTGDEPEWAERMMRIMTERCLYRDPNLTGAMLAKESGTNRTYLSQYIRETTGGTFYDYVNSFRLEEAKRLLTTTDQSIETIALQCGFSSHTTFARTFKERERMTASEYRRRV